MGNQLLALRQAGYENLSGVEVQEYALAKARLRLPDVEFVQGNAFNIRVPRRSF